MGVVVKTRPEILHAIVGTAGHVDHGKTSLVKLLTGCDTDRLPEEKARGMSIDLGFAPCILRDEGGDAASRRVVGIVDVPGHKDFIRNMVAGAASVDVLMLVIAADDGIMPQTDEHMKIVRMLRQPQVFVALTKIDMVSAERLEAAKSEVAAFLARVGFGSAPIIPVSNKTGEGIGEIREQIDALVAAVHGRSADGRAFRMSVERVFSVPGYGTVVTGIPISGQVRVGERVQLLPSPAAGRELTVRTVQMYKHESEVALASCCCAINVREIDAAQVTRGMTLATPGIYQATTEIIVALENATDVASGGGEGSREQSLKRRFAVRLHTGTAAVEASIKLLGDAEELPPGVEGLAHVVLQEPVVVAAGDRFIIRALSPADTFGGGVVLSARPQRLRCHAEAIERLTAARTAVRDGNILASELLAGPGAIVSSADLARFTQCLGPKATDKVASAVQSGLVADLGGGEFAVRSRIGEVRAVLEKVLERYHRANPYVWGMSPAHACTAAGVGVKSFDRLAVLLANEGGGGADGSGGGKIAVRHGRLALATFKPNLSERLVALREQVLSAIAKSGVNAPARGNLMKDLALLEADMKVIEKSLVGERTILVLDGNFMLRKIYEDCRAKLLSLYEKMDTVDLSAFRDAVGTHRKMAVAMLDAFDAEGLTRRVASGRVLVKKGP